MHTGLHLYSQIRGVKRDIGLYLQRKRGKYRDWVTTSTEGAQLGAWDSSTIVLLQLRLFKYLCG